MLDSRVELKNGGNKISSTKSASSSCSKKRKKQQGSSLTENGLPDMANRSPFVTGYELAINSFQPHKLRAYFEEHADVAMSLQVDMSALSPDSSLMIYREMKGRECVLSYLNVCNQVIPDAVQLFWQKNVRRLDDGSKEIETECRMIGTKFFDITVSEDSSYQQEQQILEEAIFGLTSLCKSHADSSAGKSKATSATTLAFEASSVSSSPSPLPSSESSGKTTSSEGESANKNHRSLDRINILIADDKVEFLVGDRLPAPQLMDLQGKFTWQVNSQKKITRMKFMLMKKELLEASNSPVATSTIPNT